jgi:GntR family transcriptional repressor for pyruvate dehydrogenase complex
MIHRSCEVVAQIEQDVLGGRLNPGERLPSEEKLCEQFGVSRTVIREAIQQLRGRGMLRTLKGSGSYIADPNLGALSSALETYSVLSEDDSFLQLIDFRILIETECARLAAQYAGERDLTEINENLDAMTASKGDREHFSKADIAFHLSIAKASRNSIYLTVLTGLERRCIEYASTNRGDGDWYANVISTHQKIYHAIADGQQDAAAQAMRRHLLHSRRHYIDLEIEKPIE